MSATTLRPPAPAETARSTTRRTLRYLRGVLLGLTVVVGLTSLWAFTETHRTAEAVRSRTAPAILEVSSARAALVAANEAAITSFRTGEVRLAGPGERYRSQIALVSQSLAQVAEDNAAGEFGSQTLQLVEGLLAAYTGAVEQAAAHFPRDSGTGGTGGTGSTGAEGTAGSTLGTADLWHAARLLHSDGLLAQLDVLLTAQREALDDQLAASPAGLVPALAWALPAVALFVVLVVTQVFLRRRFRRRANPALLAATLCLLGLGAVMSLTFVTQQRLTTTRESLTVVLSESRDQAAVLDDRGRRALTELVRGRCRATENGCGETMARVEAGLGRVNAGPDQPDDRKLAEGARHVHDQAGAATEYGDWVFLAPLTALLIAALVVLGLQPRLDEYRYRWR
ncbi:hypothetical protein LX15_002877 [Streptoalloteichus tenebrarius]|uniref:Integral membrane protein n=1 Tax=Streptoalloteichus tenebrarius (strain ATCC 17920 / DSM 40477 / JCM 4838 / CBS 697.72 / NBRC 16177 / NCIMB 11028 / NRRL B-12390 / A12253. 1 / ISP 5477) TaxID=1933 RepID=A0ABT1HUK4_STRSD|nr:hypothetical protein [Streptoalloteichus tenebrarius]MCP2259176.1 hypothetical protein [Streptoalloteichus tenebrarius]BFF04344.1 membrane protein [Streptoalloteichus tenebrarius]